MNNNEIKNKVDISLMFDCYKDLLTDKQKDYFNLHINEDYSLNEIADEFNVSKAAVSDSISKTEAILNNLENKLGLVKKNMTINEIVKEYQDNKNKDIEEILNRLRDVM